MESAKKRLGVNKATFLRWVQATHEEWVERPIEFFWHRNTKTYDNKQKRFFQAAWTPKHDLCMLVHSTLPILVSLLLVNRQVEDDIRHIRQEAKRAEGKVREMENTIKQLRGSKQRTHEKLQTVNAKLTQAQQEIARLKRVRSEPKEVKKKPNTDKHERWAMGGWADEFGRKSQ